MNKSSYILDPGEDAYREVRRVVRQQIDLAIAVLTGKVTSLDEAVHQTRKGIKRIRAALRAVQELCPEFVSKENKRFRAIAHRLANDREAAALQRAVAGLLHRCNTSLIQVQEGLLTHFARVNGDAGAVAKRIAEVVSALDQAKREARDWTCEHSGTGTGEILQAMGRRYAMGRRAYNHAYAVPHPEEFHNWRKRVKDQLYLTRLLDRLLPDSIREQHDSLDDLSEALGEDHDLASLRGLLLADSEVCRDRRMRRHLLTTIDERQSQLRQRASAIAQKIYHCAPAGYLKELEEHGAA